MTSRSQSIHRQVALLLATLLLTLTLAVWADDAVQPPPAAQGTPGKVLPATGGPTEQDNTKPTSAPPATSPVSPTNPGLPASAPQAPAPVVEDDKPVVLPPVKPIAYNADRDAAIGHVVGALLEQHHYLQLPITADMSQRWLKNYLVALDPMHLFFLQSDVDEFTAKYGNNLGDLLLHGDNNDAAIAPAFDIFGRYMQRLNDNIQLSEKLLHDKYDFTKDETFTIRTNKSPWIQNEAASQAIWRGQVKSDLLNGLLDKKSPDDTIKRLSRRYASMLKEAEEEDDMTVLEDYLSALTHAYDPHSDYFAPEEAEDFNIQAIKHMVTGIGAVLRTDDGYATIEEVIPGGPADLDKRLQAGDRILAVGQGDKEPVDAVNMSLKHVVSMIRGTKGSKVRLIIAPAGSSEGALKKEIVLTRDEVSIKESLAKAHIIEHRLPSGSVEKLGVIDLHDFYEKTAADVAKLVERLKKEQVAGIILDFRNNGGGMLDQAVNLTGLFVEHEPVVQIRLSNGEVDPLPSEDTRQIYDGPLLVMVNRMSASATEIVAAALQDYGRAIIVGDQSTHGKGTVQTLIPLDSDMPIGFPSDPGAGNLKMTVQKFYRVAGGSTQQKGVVPDIVLPSVLDALELGETTLPYYLPYDEVPPVPYDHLDLVKPYLPALHTNSVARVAASPDFDYMRQDIAYYKKQVQDATLSLNEDVRLKEQEDRKTLMAERKKDLLARQASRDPELDLTLDMVDQNLPAAPPDKKKPKVDLSDDSDSPTDADLNTEVNNPTVDPQLDEAVNIMADYTQMLHDSGSKLVQTTTPIAPPAPK